MSTVPAQPVITPTDRFGMTLCLAIIFHAIIVLGVTFTTEDKISPHYDTMDIILVQQKDLEPNEDSKLLAQANLAGGGDTTEKIIPASPLQPPFPGQQPQITAAPATPPGAETESQVQGISTTKIDLTKNNIEEQIVTETDNPVIAATRQKREKTDRKPKKFPTAAELLRNSFKIASLSAQIKRKLEAKSQRPRRKFISASTKAYKYAAYMEAWRSKVERVGNLNYPDEARKRKLSGNLILDVALNPDGSINEITIRRSSGYKILDDAAIRIVNLASPFAPFPDNIKRETDILHITRTWQFLNNRGFR